MMSFTRRFRSSRVFDTGTSANGRWKTCVRGVDEDLGEALGKEFVSRTFTAETREEAVRMIALIQDVMRDSISNLDWMGEATRPKAQ